MNITGYSGGEMIYERLVTGDNKGTTLNFSDIEGFNIDLIELEPVTVVARVISGANATVTSMIKWKEEW